MAVNTERPSSPLPHSLDTLHLTIADLADRAGAHPNTVRKLLKAGNIPYIVEDLVSGHLSPPEAQRPKRFRYLIPESAIQHVVATLNPPVSSPSKVQKSGIMAGNTVTLHAPAEELNRLRRDVVRLEAENALLKDHNAYMRDLTDRLLPLLPPAGNTTSQGGGPKRRGSWWRFWQRGQEEP